MASREIRNKVLIEVWRVSRVPCDPATTIYQGDLMCWDAASKTAQLGTAASGDKFLGMSDTTNPIETIGSTRFLTDTQSPRLNIVQKGLVEVVIKENTTIYPGDLVTLYGDAQGVKVSGASDSNAIGFVDFSYGAAGAVVTDGTLIKVWLLPKQLVTS